MIVLGLGNPGRKYEGTRHNMGFMVVEELARRLGIRLSSRGCRSIWGSTRLPSDREVLLAQPQTYVNESGQAAAALLGYFRAKPASLLVVHDDLDLELGQLRIKAFGGSGGHRGVQSIINQVHTDRFARVRLGLGRPPDGVDAADFVLSRFDAPEEGAAMQAVDAAAEAVLAVVDDGVHDAMTSFNQRRE